MTDKFTIIEEYYEKSNYAGLDKLYKLIKKSNSEITKSDVKTFWYRPLHNLQ